MKIQNSKFKIQNYNSKFKTKLFFSLVVGLLLASSSSVFAARSLTIEELDYKQSFTNDEEGEVKLTLNGFTEGESIFIKGAFSLPNSTNYFGYTKKEDGWVKNSATTTDQLSVKIGEWDGRLIVKPDLTDTGFSGTGSYTFKVGFYYYTSSGSLTSVNWSNSQTVNITFVPSPTPTFIPTQIPTAVPTSTSTPNPTNTPTSYPEQKKEVTPTIRQLIPSPTNTSSSLRKTGDNLIYSNENQSESVLGEATIYATSSLEEKDSIKRKNPILLILLLLSGGIVCLFSAAFLSYKEVRSRSL